jgi:hypothetical protein
LNSTTGTISGTPATVSGTFSFTVSVKDSSGATGFGSFQVTIQSPSITTPISRVGSFAQVASGGGWKTTMTLINVSAVTVNAQINLYADDGSPLTLPLAFPGLNLSASSPTVAVTLSPNSSIVVQTGGAVPTGVGWADVQATGQLSGYLTFSGSPGDPSDEATLSLDTRLSKSLLLAYDNANGVQTALALANQSASPQTLTMTLFDLNGTKLATSQIKLSAFGHSSFFLSNQLSQSANQLGIVQFDGSAAVTGIGLRFGPSGSFASIPIIR